MKTIIKSNYIDIPRYVTVKLGQKIVKRSSDLIPEESFSGRYADVNMYRGELSENSIRSLSNCETIVNRGLLIDWFVSSYELVGDVQIEDVARSSICKKNSAIAIFNHGLTHDQAKFICEKLGGQLPTFGNSSNQRRDKYRELKDLFIKSVTNTSCIVSENTNTDEAKNKDVTLSVEISVEDMTQDVFFWTGITQDSIDDKEVFINEYTKEKIEWDPNIWPGPVGNHSCTMARGNYLVKKDCQDIEPCGICEINPEIRFRLKGLCVDDLKKNSDFDTEFYAHGLFNDRLYFRGIRASHIFFDPLDNRWTLQSLKSPGKISKLTEMFSEMKYPIGRLEWTVENNETAEYGVCQLTNGQVHILTFSDCHPNKFSCNNGQCIEINDKCNGIIDCDDGTDELECEFLILDKEYSKNKLPLIQALEGPVKVYFSITMTSYPRIDTANSKIITEYDLNLKWYDPRLIFRDLKPDETFNDLGKESKTIIWSPKVEVPNALGQVSSQLNDDATSIMLLKETEEYLPEDFSLSNEGT